MTITDHLPCGCPRKRVDTRTAGVFRLRRSLSLPCCALGLHHHSEPRIVLPLLGAFETSHGRRTLPVDGSAAMYRPAWDEHRDSYHTATDSLVLLLPAETAGSAREPYVMRDPALPDLGQTLRTEWVVRDAASNLIMEGLTLLTTCIVLNRRPVTSRGKPHWIATVREQLEACYAEPPTLVELASSVDRDAAYVAATFKRVYGSSVGMYLRRLRLWQARHSIDDRRSGSIAEIALQCGYSDQSHFTRQFKQLFSVTPGEYRRRQWATAPSPWAA